MEIMDEHQKDDNNSDSSDDFLLEEFASNLEYSAMECLETHLQPEALRSITGFQAAWAVPATSCLFAREELPKLKTFLLSIDQKNDREFFTLFRVTRTTFSHLLEHIVNTNLIKDTMEDGGHHPVGPKAALYMSLAYLGKKCPYGEVADMFGVSKSTVYKHTFTVLKIVAGMTHQEIKWPTVDHYTNIEMDFRQIEGFPGVIGALDTCRVNIKAPHTDFLSETEHHSMTLLAVCDANKKFTSVHVAYPGNTHDQEVLSFSPLGKAIDTRPQTLFPNEYYHLIADQAFTLSTHVLVPYREQEYLHMQQRNYNFKLLKTRHVIESAFWWLKGRFRRLLYIDAEYDRIPVIITAACVLHNIALEVDEERELLLQDLKDFTVENPWPPVFVGYEGTDIARAKRDHLAHTLP